MKSMIVTLAMAASFCAMAVQPSTSMAAAPAAASAAAPVAPKLHDAMRTLWQGHIERTRAYAVAVEAGDKAAAAKAAAEVAANAKDIANAVGGFYGKDAGARMFDLLAGHWGGVKALTDARHAGDAAAADKAMHDLDTNASDIAKFLSGANPNLPYDAVRGLLMGHVAHHSEQIAAIMKGDKAAEARSWDAMQTHMTTLADALSGGIAKQFPAKAT